MGNNQYTRGEPGWPLTAAKIQRAMEERHKLAGELSPKQHVFTADDLAFFAKIFARHVAHAIAHSSSNYPRRQRKIAQDNYEKLLEPAIAEYKKLNKTP